MAQYLYHSYGLTVASDIPLPELAPARNSLPDVTIRRGSVPDFAGSEQIGCTFLEVELGRVLYKVEGVARFCAQGGREIVFQAEADSSDELLRSYLLGAVFSALLHQLGVVVLHGSAIEVNGKAVMFSGVCGAGKSTTAAAFYRKGYTLITDDVCVIQLSPDRTPEIVPSYPRLKLFDDSSELLVAGQNEHRFAQIQRNHQNKLGFYLREQFSQEVLPLARIYQLTPSPDKENAIGKLSGLGKIQALMESTYGIAFLDREQGRQQHLQQCAAISRTVEFFQVRQARHRLNVEAFVSLLEQHMSSL